MALLLLAGIVLVLAGIMLVRIGLSTEENVLSCFRFISNSNLFQRVRNFEELADRVDELGGADFFRNLNLYWRETYRLSQIERATNNFAHQIGQGVSGRLFGGNLGGRMVAVMRLEGGLRQDTFTRLQPLRHDHIVRLVGSCAEGEHRILIYEHVDNGTLRGHLNYYEPPMPWIARVQVLLGAACAVQYLHRNAVIHGNVTSANILIDKSLIARVSGFGALVGPALGVPSQTEGYHDPEYTLKQATDVYSLGVVMLEVLTGQPPVRANNATLVSWALPRIQAGNLDDVLDMRPTLTPNWEQLEALRMVAKTAASCLRIDGDSRRAISHVVTDLVEAHRLICQDDQFRDY